MFNFFYELKKKTNILKDSLNEFNIVNMSGKLLYVEGHKGVTVLTGEQIVFKVNKGRVVVTGEGMILIELTSNTLTIEGKILKTEIE